MKSLFIRLSSNINRDLHLKELLTGSSTALLLRIIGMAFGYIFILLISRYYGAESLGIFALSVTVLQIASVIGRLGTDTALLRFVAEFSSQARWDKVKAVYTKATIMIIPVSIALSLLLFISAPYISNHIFHKDNLFPYFQIISFAVLPMVLVAIHAESLRGLKKIKEYLFLQNASAYMLSTAFFVLSLFFMRERHAPIFIYCLSVTLTALLSIRIWRNNAVLKTVTNRHCMGPKELLDVSIPMFLSSSLFLIMQWTDTLMLAILRSEQELGIYNAALRISMFATIILFSINSIAAPKFAECYGKGDIKVLGIITKQSTKFIFWGSLPILLIIFAFPKSILSAFGKEFGVGMYALLLLTCGQFINAASGSVGFILQMTGKENIVQNITLISMSINVILNAYLIPLYGINGAACASMISIAFWNLVSVIYIKYHLNILTLYIPFFSGNIES